MPVLSGVAPLPHFSHASIDLQMCMPRSFTMFVFTTLLPLAAIICERLHPNKLLRTCPRCNGLLVLGDEYSIITSGASLPASFSPYLGAALMSLSSDTQAAGATTMFKKPCTTLYFSTAGQFSCRYLPISSAVSAGFLCDIFRKGNTTRVRLPSNVAFVLCNCTMVWGTS